MRNLYRGISFSVFIMFAIVSVGVAQPGGGNPGGGGPPLPISGLEILLASAVFLGLKKSLFNRKKPN